LVIGVYFIADVFKEDDMKVILIMAAGSEAVYRVLSFLGYYLMSYFGNQLSYKIVMVIGMAGSGLAALIMFVLMDYYVILAGRCAMGLINYGLKALFKFKTWNIGIDRKDNG